MSRYGGGGSSSGYRGPSPPVIRECRDCGSTSVGGRTNLRKVSLRNIIGWIFGIFAAGAFLLLLSGIYTLTMSVAVGVIIIIVTAPLFVVSGFISWCLLVEGERYCLSCGSTRTRRKSDSYVSRY